MNPSSFFFLVMMNPSSFRQKEIIFLAKTERDLKKIERDLKKIERKEEIA